MAGLTYVGKAPTETRDVSTRGTAEAILDSGLSRSYVDNRVTTIGSARATKTYVDTQDAQYAESAYHTTQNALLVPNAAKGASNGVASMDASSKVLAAQVPVLGAGILRGPIGPSQYFGGTTGDTPLKIAQWNASAMAYTGQLLVWANLSCQSVEGRPVVEVRYGTSTQTAYADQTLIGLGVGRQYFNDYQMITVIPATALDSEGQDGIQDALASTTNLLVNMWMYDDAGGQVTTSTGLIATAALFVARTTL